MRIMFRQQKPSDKGFGGLSSVTQTKVVAWDESLGVPPNAERVADNKALHDWQDEKPEPATAKES